MRPAVHEKYPPSRAFRLSPPRPAKLQEHAARTLCTLLSANKKLRRKAVQDGFLDKLQVGQRRGGIFTQKLVQ